jgi:subtilase family serine protease
MFSITSTAVNQGDVPAGASTTRFYFSTDSVRTADDLVLTGILSVSTLAANATLTGTLTVTVPAATPAGTYMLLACADDYGRVAEGSANETNNCAASASAVQVRIPDLVQSAVTDPPATVVAGGSFSITDTVLNQGTITASGSATRYYLSADGTATSALLLGSRSVAPLGPGASNTSAKVLTVPSTSMAGLYQLLVCADDTKVVVESNEANNCLSAANMVRVQ